MKILQIGYPKSGNYWLYKIIQEILDSAGVEKRNYIKQHPINSVARQWDLSYPEQANINMIDILQQGYFFRISSIFRKRIEDPAEYINSNTHIWSHSSYCIKSKRLFSMLDKIIYIIRDPRDVALSKADFAFTDYMKKHYPTRHSSPEEYLSAEAETIALEWKSHVKSYLQQVENHKILILFYERLKEEFDQEFKLLSNYLGFSFSTDKRDQIACKLSARRMRKQSPQHVRKAQHYKWMSNMPRNIFLKINSLTSDLLKELGYPEEENEQHLPEWKPRMILR